MQVKGGGWGALDWSPDDSGCWSGVRLDQREHLWLVDAATGQKTALTNAGGERWRTATAHSARTATASTSTTDRDSEFQRLGYIDLATQAAHAARRPTSSGTSRTSTCRTTARRSRSSTNEDGVAKLYLLDTATRTQRPVAGVPAGVIGGLHWHQQQQRPRRSRGAARARRRRLLARRDERRGDALDRERARRPGRVGPVEPELIRWKSFDGREITGFFYRPPAKFTGKRPVIINIHGGPEGQSRPDSSAATTTSSTSWASRSSSRTCAARPATARRSSSSTTA